MVSEQMESDEMESEEMESEEMESEEMFSEEMVGRMVISIRGVWWICCGFSGCASDEVLVIKHTNF